MTPTITNQETLTAAEIQLWDAREAGQTDVVATLTAAIDAFMATPEGDDCVRLVYRGPKFW